MYKIFDLEINSNSHFTASKWFRNLVLYVSRLLMYVFSYLNLLEMLYDKILLLGLNTIIQLSSFFLIFLFFYSFSAKLSPGTFFSKIAIET